MNYKGDDYKKNQLEAKKALRNAARISKYPYEIKLGIKAFKRSNPDLLGKDYIAYKKGAWAKLKKMEGANGVS